MPGITDGGRSMHISRQQLNSFLKPMHISPKLIKEDQNPSGLVLSPNDKQNSKTQSQKLISLDKQIRLHS